MQMKKDEIVRKNQKIVKINYGQKFQQCFEETCVEFLIMKAFFTTRQRPENSVSNVQCSNGFVFQQLSVEI